VSEDEMKRLVSNIAGSLSRVTHEDIIERSLGNFRNADPD